MVKPLFSNLNYSVGVGESNETTQTYLVSVLNTVLDERLNMRMIPNFRFKTHHETRMYFAYLDTCNHAKGTRVMHGHINNCA